MQSNHYRYFQKRFYGYNFTYLLDDATIASNVNIVNPGSPSEPNAHNYAEIVFQVSATPSVTANIVVVGSTDYSTSVSQVIQITPATPLNTAQPLPIFLNKIQSIVSDQPLSGLSIGYRSQYGLYTSDGGITSHYVNINDSLPEANVTWSLQASIYQYAQSYSVIEPVRNFYPFSADTTGQVTSTPFLVYLHNPVGKFKLLVTPTDTSIPESEQVLWEVGFRNYL